MKTVALYYFSGTGNTEIVANMIKGAFSQLEYTVDLIRIEDVLKKNLSIDLQPYDFVGIGSQVIGYSTPNIVHDFVRRLPAGNGKQVFIFRTSGGVAPINYNASKPIMRRLARKGYEVSYERIFSISSNWIVRFNDAIIRQLYEATRKKVCLMCQELIRGERRILKTGLGLRIAMEALMVIESWSYRLVGKDYVVAPSCNHCGLCIKNCPVSNIYKKGGSIKFKLSCNSCLRCVYACPKQAIRFRFLTFFPVAGGYNIKKILSPSRPGEEKVDGPVPPFFQNYITHDAL
jgi:ferredoxin